jgi:ferredoxin-NADP reductase
MKIHILCKREISMSHIAAQVLEKTPLTDRITAFRLGAREGAALPVWQPGAHIEVHLADGQMRSYSLIAWEAVPDAPSDYLIAVQREDEGGGGSRAMHALGVGDALTMGTPKNSFALHQGAPAVLLAGGIGVTPMISMAAAQHAQGLPCRFHYAGRSAAIMAYREALETRFGAQIHCDDYAPAALDLDALIAGLGDAHLYVCGPRGMIDAARARADAAGIPEGRIHFELFVAATAGADDQPFEVELNDGSIHIIPPATSIIEVLEAAGIDVMYDCQRGDCGICQCDVLEGIPDHRDVVLSQSERDSGKVMQICVSRAKTPRLKLDI